MLSYGTLHATTHCQQQQFPNIMGLHFWSKRFKQAHLESRVRRLEKDKKRHSTATDYWNIVSAENHLLRRVGALERWQEETDVVLIELMKDVTTIERKLNKVLPFDDRNEVAVLERPAVVHDRDPEYNRLEPHGVPSKLSPSELPTTFTRRKEPDDIDRVALDTLSLRASKDSG
jgi:hypothetical protein